MMVTVEPIGPTLGETPVTETDSITVNCAPLLVTPSSLTVTGPLVALPGTMTVILVSLQEVGAAVTELNCTVLLPRLDPKPMPFRVIVPPSSAAGGERLLIVGLITKKPVFEGLDTEFT